MLCPKCTKAIPDDAVYCCYCGKPVARQKRQSARRPSGTGSVYKRGKTWAVSVVSGWKIDATGKYIPVRKYRGGFKTKADAINYTETLRQEKAENLHRIPTLSEYWQIYSTGEMEKLSHDKCVAYKIAWKKLQPLASAPVDTLTVADLRKTVSAAASTYYPARDMKTVLSHLFKLAGADGHASKDLPSYIILPELNETEREPFTEEEQTAIWKAYESGVADAAIPLVMIYTGMMTGEMRRLTVEMIHLDTRQIIGVGLKTGLRKSKSTPVFIPDDIVPVLDGLMEGKTDRLFTCSEDDFYARYYAALSAAGTRRLTPYSCRHTTATALAITNNIAPQTIKKIMRWTTTKMLDRYAHPDNTDAMQAINTLQKKQDQNSPEK